MKKHIFAVISFVLCFCLLIPPVFAAAEETNDYESVTEFVTEVQEEDVIYEQTPANAFFTKFLNKLSNFFINDFLGKFLSKIVPDSIAVKDFESFNLDEYGNFYEGNETFIDEPQGDKVWSLGFGKASVLPEDFNEKQYAKGAYLPYVFGNAMYKDDDGNDEDLMARAIVMNDGSGRGNVVFISVDAMGLANADVRLIREGLSEIAKEYNIVSINVSCTHIHTGIDSQGVWTDPLGCIIKNSLSSFTGEVKYGVERSFIESLVSGSREAVEEALADMKTGDLYYSVADAEEYVHDRTAPISLDKNLYKLEFVPFSAEATPTIIATFGVHPESSSYDWSNGENGKLFDDKFTADFIWYTEKLLNSAGYNFIFIQGNVSTVTSSRHLTGDGIDQTAHYSAVRYGYEIGYILLGMSKTQDERIAINETTGDKMGIAQYNGGEEYTVWYEDLPVVEAVQVKPVLNIKLSQFTVKIENNIIALLGKTSVADNLVLKDDAGNYYTVSEVGYLEIGDEMKVYMSPGETFGELLFGGEGAEGFELSPIREYTGEDIIIMDLMNDAAGYVANPENYVLAGLQYNENSGANDSDTWCLISYGENAATSFIGNFYKIFDSVK